MSVSPTRPSSAQHHRKIDLQSRADLDYLIANATRAAKAKLDMHFPPAAAPTDGEDELRKRVEGLVDEFITHTFTSASPSITLNGLDAPSTLHPPQPGAPPQEEYEPYDTTLSTSLSTAAATLEHLVLELAELRRTAPLEAARNFQGAFGEEVGRGDGVLRGEEEGALKRVGEQGGVVVGEGLKVERLGEVEREWVTGTEGLVELKGGLTETVARLERAKAAVEYLEGR